MVAWSSLKDANAITMKGAPLGRALVKKRKPVENRAFGLHGWRWIHVGQGKMVEVQRKVISEHADDLMECDADLKGYVIGAVHFSHVLSRAEAKTDPAMAPWSFGPMCSVVDDAFELEHPVGPIQGALSNWSPCEATMRQLKRQFFHQFKANVPLPPQQFPTAGIKLTVDAAAIRGARRELNGLRTTSCLLRVRRAA